MTDKGKTTLVGLGILGVLAWLFSSSEDETKTIDTTAEVIEDDQKKLSGIGSYYKGGADTPLKHPRKPLVISKIKSTLDREQPKTWKELTEVLAKFNLAYGVAWNNIFYMGAYQGVRLYIWDRKGTKHYLPSKTDSYRIKQDERLPGIHVDSTGKELSGTKSTKKLSGNDIIYLKDFKDVVFEEAKKRNEPEYHYSDKELTDALNANVKDELRYNLKTGKTYNKHMGKVSEFTNKEDIINYETPEEAAKWSFTGFVRNSASRVKRGYSAI